MADPSRKSTSLAVDLPFFLHESIPISRSSLRRQRGLSSNHSPVTTPRCPQCSHENQSHENQSHAKLYRIGR